MENEKGEETAREFLKRMRVLAVEVRSLKATYSQLCADLKVLRAIDYSKDRVDGGAGADMGDLVARYMDIGKDLKDKIRELMAIKHQGFKLIQQVKDPVSVIILLLRYVNNRPWAHIQKQMHYEKTRMYDLHSKAIKDFCKIYKERSKTEY